MVPFLEFVGLPESIVGILKNSESGNVLTAYALYKVNIYLINHNKCISTNFLLFISFSIHCVFIL